MLGLRTRSAAADQAPSFPIAVPPTAIAAKPHFFRSAPVPQQAAEAGRTAKPLPTIAPGQVWLIEARGLVSALRPFEAAAFTAANVVIYDPGLVEFVAASLPLGNYAEAHREGARPEFERALQLALDGWSVIRLIDGDSTPDDRADRLRRAGQQLRAGGVAGEFPVDLVFDLAGGYEATETSLGDLSETLDEWGFNQPLTAVFATRYGGHAPSRSVVENGLAG